MANKPAGLGGIQPHYCGHCCTKIGPGWIYCAICGSYLVAVGHLNSKEADIRIAELGYDSIKETLNG